MTHLRYALLWVVLAATVAQAQQFEKPPLQQAPAADIIPGTPMTAASATGNGRASPLSTLASLGADYRIGPNDLLDIDVYGVPDLKRSVRVNSSGQISQHWSAVSQ